MKEISICINKEDYDLISDIKPEKYGLIEVTCFEGTDDEYKAFEGVISDENYDEIIENRDASPYGDCYEIMLWRNGNSVII